MLRWPGFGDPVQLVLSVLTDPQLALTQPLAALQQIGALGAAVQGLVAWAIPGGGNGAHGAYPITKPIPNDPRTSIQIAVDYLNQTAAAQ
jgi:hypothetical protein